MLALAFDTATETATCALVREGACVGERRTTARALLRDVEALVAAAGVDHDELGGIVVGRGPGSYTSLRMGLVTARTLAFVLGVPLAGVSTLDALAAGADGATPVIDARRGEVFTLVDGEPRCLRPEELRLDATLAIGDGAVRYRETLEAAGAVVPQDGDERHVPWARHHARLVTAWGGAELAEPIYLRAPDADRAVATREGRA
jgi:tRNA threonylcarbamoyladenosine biosynthesis protein TsaB